MFTNELKQLANLFKLTFKAEIVFSDINSLKLIHLKNDEIFVEIHKDNREWTVYFSKVIVKAHPRCSPFRAKLNSLPFINKIEWLDVDGHLVLVRKLFTHFKGNYKEAWELIFSPKLTPSEVFRLTLRFV